MASQSSLVAAFAYNSSIIIIGQELVQTHHFKNMRAVTINGTESYATVRGLHVLALAFNQEYRKIKRPFPPTVSASPMPLCSRWCLRLTSARPPRTAHPGEHPTRACPRRPAPPGATPRRRAWTGRVAGDGLPARLEGTDSNAMRAVKEAMRA